MKLLIIYLVFKIGCAGDSSADTTSESGSATQSDVPSLHCGWSVKTVAIERTKSGLESTW